MSARRMVLALLSALGLWACTHPWVDASADGMTARFPSEPVEGIAPGASRGVKRETLTAEWLNWKFEVDREQIPDGMPIGPPIMQRIMEETAQEGSTRVADFHATAEGFEFNAIGTQKLERCGRVLVLGDRLFRITVTGRGRVHISPDLQTFYGGFHADSRPRYVAPVLPVREINRSAVRDTAESWMVLMQTGRMDEAWRYLPAGTRARVSPASHAHYWAKRVPNWNAPRVVSIAWGGSAATINFASAGKAFAMRAVETSSKGVALVPDGL